MRLAGRRRFVYGSADANPQLTPFPLLRKPRGVRRVGGVIDVGVARALTPGCEGVVHLNNAGASLAPQPVLDAVVGHLRRESELGGYEAEWEAEAAIHGVYSSVARLVGGRPDEVALVESATVAWDAAFYAIPWQRGDRILTGRAEYVSNALAMLQVQRRHGVVVEVIDDDEHGQISLAQLADRLHDREAGPVRLVALTHVPTGGGLVNPAPEVGALARDAGALYLLDACQSAGQLPLDVTGLGCDMLSATGRKFLRGPRGTGFLWVRAEVAAQLEPHVVDLRAAEWTSPDTYRLAPGARRFETWERSWANALGLGAAVDHALGWGLAEIEQRNASLAGAVRAGLAAIAGVTVRDLGLRRSAIVTFTVDGRPSAEVSAQLRARGINTSVTTAGSAQHDLPRRGITDMVRASVHYYNTEDEVAALLDAVGDLAAAPGGRAKLGG